MWSNIQKSLKNSESYISMALGLIVVLLAGSLIYNFVNNKRPQTPQKAAQSETLTKEEIPVNAVPTVHQVAPGENLWVIAEKYYHSGYNWVTIAKENNLTDPGLITAGQKLTLSQAEIIVPKTETMAEKAISAETYTVVKGDSLWEIAIRTYGDGFAWTRIAQANHLTHPSLIHPGNVLSIPR